MLQDKKRKNSLIISILIGVLFALLIFAGFKSGDLNFGMLFTQIVAVLIAVSYTHLTLPTKA